MQSLLQNSLLILPLVLAPFLSFAKDPHADTTEMQVELKPLKKKIEQIKKKKAVGEQVPGGPVITEKKSEPIPALKVSPRPVPELPEENLSVVSEPLSVPKTQPISEPTPTPVHAPAPETPPAQTTAEKPTTPIFSMSNLQPEFKPVAADTSLTWLKNGNVRYLSKNIRKDGIMNIDRARTLDGERPHAVIWTSSDSRVAPEVIFDQKIGEIYVVRNFGPSMNESTVASLEYAIQSLGSQLIIVMTQSHSEPIRKALQESPDETMTSGMMSLLFNDLRPRLTEYIAKAPSPGFRAEAWTLAKSLADDLPQQSLVIRNNLPRGLKIKTAVYDLESGKVEFR
ncbi:MAG: carbonic anhydrase [Pseudobdellovibrionaceae bacterium]